VIPPVFPALLPEGLRAARLDIEHRSEGRTRAAGLALGDAMEAWRQGSAGPPGLGLIQDAIACDSRVLSPYAAIALGELIADAPDPLAPLLAVFRAAPAFSRCMILRWVRGTRALPRDAMLALVSEGLADRSRRVRGVAAQQVEPMDLRELLPALRAMRTNPADAEYATEVHRAITLMEQGFIAERQHRVYTVQLRARLLFDIPAEVVDAVGLPAAIDHARAWPEPHRGEVDWTPLTRHGKAGGASPTARPS
jgi:hypothetical protein